MTFKQEIAITKAKEKIEEIRHLLDDAMYNNPPSEALDDKTFFKVREAYELICQANDKLP